MIEWKFNGKYLDGYLAGYNLYTILEEGGRAYLQGATLKAMSSSHKTIGIAKEMAEVNAIEFVKAIKEKL